MISCKTVATLLLSGQLSTQPWWTRLGIRLHLAMCTFCSRLARQIGQLRSGAQLACVQNEPDSAWEQRLIRRIQR